uniref:Phenylalanyl tRNA synthetase beta chain core domain-containing protein n=1 Tax=Brassica oleracea TaxID=3712 RepID=A0A3P6D0K7_BRAOL|nr:unnamed protein product [Brassica oleracea]
MDTANSSIAIRWILLGKNPRMPTYDEILASRNAKCTNNLPGGSIGLMYDLLCLEGLAQALRVFNKKQKIPSYRLVDIGREKMLKMNVKSDQVYVSVSFHKTLSLNEFSDLLGSEIVMNVYTEVMTWLLCSHKENFALLNKRDDNSAVLVANPRSADLEVIRSSLMPGLLKTVGSNKDHPKPIKTVGASNRRHLAALHCGATSGFELIHGLVDRIMEVMGVPSVQTDSLNCFFCCNLRKEPEFLPGKQASIIYKGKHVGNFGIVHPQVLNNFDIIDPYSLVEIDMEALLSVSVLNCYSYRFCLCSRIKEDYSYKLFKLLRLVDYNFAWRYSFRYTSVHRIACLEKQCEEKMSFVHALRTHKWRFGEV